MASSEPGPSSALRALPTFGRLQGVGWRGQESTLSLCGRGYRAALFHLGALTRLNELALLARLNTVGAAAGGSILAAFLATRVPWPLPGAYRDWLEQVAEPVREITRRNARARAFLRHPFPGRATEDGLEERYARRLVEGLGGPPKRPGFVFGASGLALGGLAGDREAEGIEWKLEAAAHPPGYDPELVAGVIAAVRTDLDAFGDAEAAVLENHGYLLVDAALRQNARAAAGGIEPHPPQPPHPHWMNEDRVREALAASSRRSWPGRIRPRRAGLSRPSPERASAESTELLERHRPILQYDSLESYRADSVATIANLVSGRRRNSLHRADGALIASTAPGGEEAKLDIDFLRGPSYPDGQAARADDYLDEAGGAHAVDAREMRRRDGYADLVYGHARHDAEGRLWLQYWFFYYFSDKGLLGIGIHEGDWEMIQLRLGRDGRPDGASYGQHGGGRRASWSELERVQAGAGEAPIVYPARGSHACHLRRGCHRAPVVPDFNDGEGPRVRPRVTPIADDGPGWVLWPGRWGSTRRREAFEADSPRGPREHPQWWDPAAFHAEASPAKEVPPGKEARLDLPRPPQAELKALRDGGRALVGYRFPAPVAGDGRPERIVVAPYGAGDSDPLRRSRSRSRGWRGR